MPTYDAWKLRSDRDEQQQEEQQPCPQCGQVDYCEDGCPEMHRCGECGCLKEADEAHARDCTAGFDAAVERGLDQ